MADERQQRGPDAARRTGGDEVVARAASPGADGPSDGIAEAAHGAAVAPLESLAMRVGDRAGLRAAFGEPIHAQGVTVIPVARTRWGFGAGIGRVRALLEPGVADMGGGGGGAVSEPEGFLVVENGRARFERVHNPARTAAIAAAGVVLGLFLARR